MEIEKDFQVSRLIFPSNWYLDLVAEYFHFESRVPLAATRQPSAWKIQEKLQTRYIGLKRTVSRLAPFLFDDNTLNYLKKIVKKISLILVFTNQNFNAKVAIYKFIIY